MVSDELTEQTAHISSLLSPTAYKEAYLVLYNPNTASGVSYTMESSE